jgi:hypothetical protein
MTDTAASLQAQLDAIRAAYRAGITRVAYDGKSTDYRDASEMRAAIASIENAINGYAGANAPRPSTYLVRSRKGW